MVWPRSGGTPTEQRALADEVAVDVAGLLSANGVVASRDGDTLDLRLPQPRLLRVRSGKQPDGPRVVLDLAGPAVVRRDARGLVIGLESDGDLLAQLASLGLRGRQGSSGLSLAGVSPTKLFTLGDPARVVIDLPAVAGSTASAKPEQPAPIDPRLRSLLGPELKWERQVRQVEGERMLVTSVKLDPRTSPWS